MCFLCPDCNADNTDSACASSAHAACMSYTGSNSDSMSGYAGLATGMAFATEYQGEATPHGHGFVSLVNMYQHHNLNDIKDLIERNHQGISTDEVLERVTHVVEHLQREDQFN